MGNTRAVCVLVWLVTLPFEHKPAQHVLEVTAMLSNHLLLLSILTISTISTVAALKCYTQENKEGKEGETTCATDTKYCWSFFNDDSTKTKTSRGCATATQTDATKMLEFMKGKLDEAGTAAGMCVPGKSKVEPKEKGKMCYCDTDNCVYSGADSLQMSGLI